MTIDELKIIMPDSLETINLTIPDGDEVINLTVSEGEILKVIVQEGLGHGVGNSIDDHRDVAITNVKDKDNLVYDIALGKFINKKILKFDADYNCFVVE